MVSATECRKVTDEVLREKNKEKMEWLERRAQATRDYCNDVLSVELERASKTGKQYYEIGLMSCPYYCFKDVSNHELLTFSNSYWRHTWRNVDIELIKHIAELHGYTVIVTEEKYQKGPQKYWQGICMRISW